jgi:hypothetical protein
MEMVVLMIAITIGGVEIVSKTTGIAIKNGDVEIVLKTTGIAVKNGDVITDTTISVMDAALVTEDTDTVIK